MLLYLGGFGRVASLLPSPGGRHSCCWSVCHQRPHHPGWPPAPLHQKEISSTNGGLLCCCPRFLKTGLARRRHLVALWRRGACGALQGQVGRCPETSPLHPGGLRATCLPEPGTELQRRSKNSCPGGFLTCEHARAQGLKLFFNEDDVSIASVNTVLFNSPQPSVRGVHSAELILR